MNVQFNVTAAIVLGALLPTLETVRRGFDHWFVNFTTMFEDYVGGLALLACGVGALRRARWAPVALLIVWSGVTFMMLVSVTSQIERHFWSADPEPRSALVLVFKLLLLLACLVALWQSARPENLTLRAPDRADAA